MVWFALAILYLVGIGFTYACFYHLTYRRRLRVNRLIYGNSETALINSHKEAENHSVIKGVLWPVYLPIWIGIETVNLFGAVSKRQRKIKRLDAEIKRLEDRQKDALDDYLSNTIKSLDKL